jgi:hypothetical protein
MKNALTVHADNLFRHNETIMHTAKNPNGIMIKSLYLAIDITADLRDRTLGISPLDRLTDEIEFASPAEWVP